MTKFSKSTALVLGVLVAGVAAPSIANAGYCNTYFSTKFRSTEHRARQAAILDVNHQWNSAKARAVPIVGNARRLNQYIRIHFRIRPIKLRCARSGTSYICKARKTICKVS